MKQLDFIGENAAAVTPSDSATFGPSIIYVGGAGVVVVRDVHGNATAFTAVAGGRLPVLATGVNSTNTTGTLIVRVW